MVELELSFLRSWLTWRVPLFGTLARQFQRYCGLRSDCHARVKLPKLLDCRVGDGTWSPRASSHFAEQVVVNVIECRHARKRLAATNRQFQAVRIKVHLHVFQDRVLVPAVRVSP